MSSVKCVVEGCDRLAVHKRGKYIGLCVGHRSQVQRGYAEIDNLKPMRRKPYSKPRTGPVLDRFFQKVEKTETCWNWTGGTIRGYGSVSIDGRTRRAHRVSYELLVGPLSPGTVIHHTCANRRCVNPEHLQQITYHENTAEMIERHTYQNKIAELELEIEQLKKQMEE